MEPVDGIVVGRGVSDAAQAAVGASFSITYMMTCVFLGIGIGAAVLAAQYAGAGDRAGVRKCVMSMNSFLILVSIPLTVIAILTAGPFLRLLNVNDDIFGLSPAWPCPPCSPSTSAGGSPSPTSNAPKGIWTAASRRSLSTGRC